MKKYIYAAPELELIEIEIEQGIAQSRQIPLPITDESDEWELN